MRLSVNSGPLGPRRFSADRPRLFLASSSPLCGHSLQTAAATMREWRTHGDNHVCLKLFGLFTFAGNFRADYFPALTDGAIKRS